MSWSLEGRTAFYRPKGRLRGLVKHEVDPVFGGMYRAARIDEAGVNVAELVFTTLGEAKDWLREWTR